MEVGRIPPQYVEAEKSILGGLMLDQEAWDQIEDIVAEYDFYSPVHRKIFLTIKSLRSKGTPSDLITVSNALLAVDQLEDVGGPPYLAELVDQTPSIANIEAYARIIKEKSLLRDLIQVCQKNMDDAYAQTFESVESFVDRFESQVFNLAEKRESTELVKAGDIVKQSLERLEQLFNQKGQLTGVPSGFIELDEMTAGFQPGELIIVAARPSMGKTAFSLNMALHAALREKKNVAYFSVEMGKEALMMRMLASEARISLSKIRVGEMGERDWPQLIEAASKMNQAGLFIDETSNISPFEIRARCRRLKARFGLDMIIVDYLQLMSLKQKVDNREREVSEISRMLKSIGKELKVPVIALAQLNRGVEGRSDRRPMLSDLRESGSIEQDADVIMMLYREEYYSRDNPEVRGLAEVIVGKQRNGPTGAVKLRWKPDFGLFMNNVDDHLGPAAPLDGPPKNFAPSF